MWVPASEVSILELAKMIARVVGFSGELDN